MSRAFLRAIGIAALLASGRVLAAADAGAPPQETLDAGAVKAAEPNLADGGTGGLLDPSANASAASSASDAGVASGPSDAGAVPMAALPSGALGVADAGTADGGPLGVEEWLASGQPLGLRDLQDIARQVDPRALIAYSQLEGARGQQMLANWIWFPDFATTVGGGGPTPETRLNGANGGSNNTDIFDLTPGTRQGLFGGEWGVAVRVDVSTSMPIYTFGKISAAQAAAGHGVEARTALLQGQRNQAAYDVARAYWGYQTTRDAQKSINEMRGRLDAAKKQAQQLLDDKSDQVTQTDFARLDYISDEVEAQSDAAVANQRLSEAALKLLVGKTPEDTLMVVRETVPPPPLMPDLPSLLEQARAHRPDLKAAAENVEARKSLLDLEHAKYYPDVAIVAGFTFSDTTNASNPDSPFVYDPYHQYSGYVALGVKGTFDIPQKIARVRQVEAQLHEAIATQTGAERLVRLEIEQSLADLASARGRAVHYISGSGKAKKLLVKGAVGFDSGLGQASELLIDTLLYSRAEGERLKALLDAQVAWAALERAVGGPVKQIPTPIPTVAAEAQATPAPAKADAAPTDTTDSSAGSSNKKGKKPAKP